jgi:glycosyltransferase involved in cell wall biosynthesis
MLSEVDESIKALGLKDAVELVGRIPHDAVEDFLNSADFIIQSSRREVAGYSVVEAMACGVVPVVTDIPSFRAMTENGSYGVLFPAGNHELLADRVLALGQDALEALSRQVRAQFVRSLSYDAMAQVYERALQGRA